MKDLSRIVKAYDVRGLVPGELDEDVAYAIGAAFVHILHEPDPPSAIVVGQDMRPSSPRLAKAFSEGVVEQGVAVVDIGLASTDLVYFASGILELPGAMFTASHNPADYNGIKLCREGARPVGQNSGLSEIRDIVENDRPRHRARGGGSTYQRDMLPEYAQFLHNLVPVRGRRLRVVVDAGNGMAGHTVPSVLGPLDVDLVPMYFDLDGSFPNHPANPIEPSNLLDLSARVRSTHADIGLAFDGDADRCFVVDERGQTVSPSALTALIAIRELAREPGATVIHNLITSRAVPALVRSHGGTPVRTRVGHSFIKAQMASSQAIFGGEHSGHFYFRDFWYADSGMIAALHTIASVAESDLPLSALVSELDFFASSGEVNSTVRDHRRALDLVESAWVRRPGVTADHLDGLTIEHADWWFNLRPSNTEPLLRLNVEAEDIATMERVRDEVLAMLTEPAHG